MEDDLEQDDELLKETLKSLDGLRWLDSYAKHNLPLGRIELAKAIRADNGLPENARNFLASVLDGTKRLPKNPPPSRFNYNAM